MTQQRIGLALALCGAAIFLLVFVLSVTLDVPLNITGAVQ